MLTILLDDLAPLGDLAIVARTGAGTEHLARQSIAVLHIHSVCVRRSVSIATLDIVEISTITTFEIRTIIVCVTLWVIYIGTAQR
eukprot:SAG31_NODE_2130_length_6384_cov_8.343994_6_plen_85_part_00